MHRHAETYEPTIALSARAAAENPALACWLHGAGLRTGDGPGPAILAVEEADRARPGDLILAPGGDMPFLQLGGADAPAFLTFGRDDMAFGHALAAEMVRPEFRPACGEPESAATLALAERIAASDATVLVLGETGTGKEGIARYIHAVSPRRDGPFVAVNCAALPDTMLEAILFGHRKGSFTGAASEGEGLFRAANGGTLLLDEVAEIPLALQAKLLRALQEREVLPVGAVKAEAIDVRVIACANRDLAAEVAAGRFRSDLYWRLNVVPVGLKPLAERRLDVRAIAAAMLVRHHAADARIHFPTPAALDRLMAHDWPGNCRELDNVLQRALLLGQGSRIEAADLIIDRAPATHAPRETIRPATLGGAARRAEAEVIHAALVAADGHRGRAAQCLGISERTLRYRLADMRAAAA